MKTINISLSEASIKSAVEKLKKIKAEVEKRQKDCVEQVLNVGLRELQAAFGKSADTGYKLVSSENGKLEYELYANGEAVCFIEFGTGFSTDASHEYAGVVSIAVEPGSWSDVYGAGTFSKWVESGKDPKDYPYNHEPHYGFVKAYNAMKDSAEKILKGAYKGL